MNTRPLDAASIAKAIAYCRAHSPHTVPLLEAAQCRAISLAGLTQRGTLPAKTLERTRLPALVVVGDDCADGTDTGPDGWAATRSLARWARYAVIHGSGGTVEEYRRVVLLAVQVRKLVLVECGNAHLMAWHQVFAGAGVPTLNIYPSDGAHPVRSSRGTVH